MKEKIFTKGNARKKVDAVTISRRKFLQVAGITTATLALNPVGKAGAQPAVVSDRGAAGNPEVKGMLIDITKCIGCGICSTACQEQNGLHSTQNEKLDDETWTVLKSVEVDIEGKKENRFVRHQCFHCLDPACASACLVGALEKTPEGAVIYDGDKCMGCRYCMIACPFGIPKYQWESPFTLVRKCIFCHERLKAGEAPACASVCPTQATLFGSREELVEEAIARIQSNPEKYVPHVYGLEEVGGTSIMYLSDVPFEELGFPTDVGTRPLSEYTWMALSKVPAVVVGGALVLGAAYKLSKDRGEENEA